MNGLNEKEGINFMKKFEGVFPALPTPFTQGGDTVDEASLRKVVDYLIGQGVHGLFATGATGEGPTIPPDERKQIIDIVIDQAAGRVTIIFQVAYNLIADTIDIAKYAAQAGADGVAILTPWFFECDSKAMVKYVLSIAETIPETPLFLYNIPARTGNNYSYETVSELKERCPSLAGIKESGNLNNLARWMELQDERFQVFCGMDPHEYDAYRLGSRSIVASFANWLPDTFVAFHEAASAGRWDEARALQSKIIQTITPAINPNHLANIKTALRMKGVPAGYVRPPLRDLTEEEESDLRRNMIAVGFLSE